MNTSTLKSGFSLIETILAIAIFMIIGSGLVVAAAGTYMDTRSTQLEAKAAHVLATAWDELRYNRSGDWAALQNGTTQVAENEITRTITIADAYRDEAGQLVASGGTLDPDTKRITVSVAWPKITGQENTITVDGYLTNYTFASPWPL